MPSSKDRQGRPTVVVTGLRRDHLARRRQDRQLGQAHRRRIRHSRHHPFPDRRPAHPHCRHHRLSAAAKLHGGADGTVRRARRRGGDCRIRHRREGRFSRAAVCGGAADRGRVDTADRNRGEIGRQRQGVLQRPAAGEHRLPRLPRTFPDRFGRRPSGRQIRQQGLADLAVHRLRLGRNRHPARCRSDPARRDRCRALRRHRRLDQPGSGDPVFLALGPLHQQRRAASGGQTVLQESRRLRHGRRRRRAGARELRLGQGARRQNPRRAGRLRRDDRCVPPHAFEPRRQADHRLHCQRDQGCRPDTRRHRLRQRARHQHAGKRQDGISRLSPRCSASA